MESLQKLTLDLDIVGDARGLSEIIETISIYAEKINFEREHGDATRAEVKTQIEQTTQRVLNAF